jgi:hypothetical protein
VVEQRAAAAEPAAPRPADPLDDLDHRPLDAATVAAIDEALGLPEVTLVRT